jgi:hypothetical protein
MPKNTIDPARILAVLRSTTAHIRTQGLQLADTPAILSEAESVIRALELEVNECPVKVWMCATPRLVPGSIRVWPPASIEDRVAPVVLARAQAYERAGLVLPAED